MPMDRSRYPAEWPAIARGVRERSGGRCECHGECGRDHAGDCDRHGRPPGPTREARCAAVHGAPHPVTGSRVVLTAAHLWRGPCAEHAVAGIKCGDLEHLAALCQRCHLAYDLPHHVANARRTRRKRKALGDLFDCP